VGGCSRRGKGGKQAGRGAGGGKIQPCLDIVPIGAAMVQLDKKGLRGGPEQVGNRNKYLLTHCSPDSDWYREGLPNNNGLLLVVQAKEEQGGRTRVQKAAGGKLGPKMSEEEVEGGSKEDSGGLGDIRCDCCVNNNGLM